MFASLQQMVLASAEAVRPPERIDVPTAAERYHIVKTAGQHAGPFSLAKTPYLREPMEVLTSLDYTGMIFAGPARTGKSAMFINWLCHTAITDPSDMMLVHMSRQNAREWSMGDLAKAIRNSPELKKRLLPGKQNDNVFDKAFLSGMRMSITWPTIENLSGKTIRYCWIMDSDRIKPQLIDNEAHVYDATKKRTGTFKRFGMTVAEASPGFPVKDAKWIPNAAEPHEAPPCEGILSLYNRGDRRRWFWQCVFCGGTFEPRFNLLRWPDSTDLMESAEQVHMACPHCFEHNKDPLTFSMLPELNGNGRWIKEGQVWLPDGQIVGTARRSDIASFWMFGPAAGLASDWKHLVLTYLRACEDYEKTGNDANLMTTVTVDQGEAYVPPSLQGGLLPDVLKARAEDWGGHDANGDPYIPAKLMADGGFLISAIDVQAGGRPSFVVHTFAVSKGFDIWHVDMRKIVKSERIDETTPNQERHGLDPAAYPEDWDVLIKQVMERTYPLSDGTGRRMAVKMTVCDSGGKDGVTRNAYEFYRRLKAQGLHKRFHLVKGSPSRTETATIRLTMPDSQHKDKFSIARGDVPVWLVNSNIVKDAADAKLRRAEPGGMIHFPVWAQNWLYSQLTTEVRLPEGWKNPNDKRNEAWDLLVYCIAACDHPDIQIRFLNWDNPPSWAAPLDHNDFIVSGDVQPFKVEFATKPKRSLAELAASLA
ncbi:terminase gpA endonuclease subunit [Sphingomonas hankookensis]|uniref:terminase gpA endonuclease subunit n=1 Tax=Sphingomonas hankookensis TaxID=563996 RepID=UPI003D302D71